MALVTKKELAKKVASLVSLSERNCTAVINTLLDPSIPLTAPEWEQWGDPQDPAKWVARLRAMKTDPNPLLFHVGLTGGHCGASDRYERLRELAFRGAFLMAAVGLGGSGLD